jgi:hypothetical protein
MKLWEMNSILEWNSKGDLSVNISAERDEWNYLKPLFEGANNYSWYTDIEKLEAILPEDFVKRVLEESRIVCYRSKKIWYEDVGADDGLGRWYIFITEYKTRSDDELMTAFEVYKQYGGKILETVFEKTSAAIEEGVRNSV